jgi:DNA-binding winged helix-turn-helix (wHTH) protein
LAEESLRGKKGRYNPPIGALVGMNQDFRLGRWVVQPSLNSITLDGTITRLEPKAMEVLVCLAEHAGNVVSKEQLIGKVWTDLFVSDDVLTRCISDLRRALDDNPKAPQVIETIPKRGYRLLKEVEPVCAPSPQWFQGLETWLQGLRVRRAPRKGWGILATVAALALLLASVESRPWIARLYNNRGAQLQKQGRIQEAIQDYRRALSLRSDYAEAHYNLADSYEVRRLAVRNSKSLER